MTSSWHFFLITGDRYLKLRHNFVCMKHSSPKLAYYLCAGCWALGMVILVFFLLICGRL